MARTHGRSLIIHAGDAENGSRIGGTPPRCLAEAPPCCQDCRGALEYLLTLGSDVLTWQGAPGRAVSVLFCRDEVCLVRSHALVDRPAITVLAHPDDPRATAPGELDSRSEGRRITAGPATEDPRNAVGHVVTDDSKLGGHPGYLQGWGAEEASTIASRRCDFLFQFSEMSYPNRMEHGKFAFLCGVLYVFSSTDVETGLPELSDFTSFWQNT